MKVLIPKDCKCLQGCRCDGERKPERAHMKKKEREKVHSIGGAQEERAKEAHTHFFCAYLQPTPIHQQNLKRKRERERSIPIWQ